MQKVTQNKLVQNFYNKNISDIILKLLNDQNDSIFYIYNLNSNEITWEGSYKELLGYNDSEMSNFNISDWENSIYQPDKQKTLDLLVRSIQTKIPYNVSYSFKSKNGNFLYIEDYGDFYNENGVDYLIGRMQDASEKIFLEKLINVLSEIVEKITKSRSLKDTLVYISQKIDEIFNNDKISSINLIDNKKIKQIYSYQLSENLKSFLTGLDLIKGNGITHHILESKEHLYVPYIKESIYFENIHKIYTDNNINSAIGYPIFGDESECIATLNVFKNSFGEFDSFVSKHIDKFIGLIKIAIEKNIQDQELQKLASVVENAKNMILIFDENNNITWANDSFFRFTELTPQEILNQNILNFPKSRIYNPLQIEYLQNSILKHESYNLEIYNINKSGKPYWVELSGTPNYDKDNIYIGYTQIERDITDKKESELKFQKNEKFLLSITSNMTEGIYRSTPDKGIIYCNDAFVRLFGYNSVDEVIEQKGENLYYYPEDRIKFLKKLKFQKKIINEEIKFKKKNGDVFWGLINTSYFDENGIGSYQDGFINDITQLKEVSSKLKSYNSQLENVMNAINNSTYVAMLDLDFNIKFVNHKICELLNFNNTELVGQNIIKYIYNGEENKNWNNLIQVVLLGNPFRREIDFTDSEQQIMWLDVVINPIKDENELSYGYYFIANDITDKKIAEASIKELNESLELKVDERTSLLNDALDEVRMLNSSLYETNKSLTSLNEEKNDFISLAAHDLKNPLQGIMFAAELIKTHLSKLTTEQILYNMVFIESTSKRMSDIIHNYLNVTSIESGLFNFNFQNLDIKYTTDELIKSYIPIAEKKSVRLFYDTDNVTSIIDKNAFIQIIENLISNAIKFSPSDKTINVNLEVNENNFTINVIDEGPGLTELDKQNLFKKFAKLSAKPTAGENSTGLGLSIVKKLAELMNGKISCSSEYGKGAIFSVSFPIRQA